MKNNTFWKVIVLALVWCLTMGGVPAVADTASASCTHPNINNVVWGEWDAEEHFRQCPDCSTEVYGNHTGGTATCPHLVRQEPGDLIGVCYHDALREAEDAA